MAIYTTNAERQRAYRERLQSRLIQRIDEHEQQLAKLQAEIDRLLTIVMMEKRESGNESA